MKLEAEKIQAKEDELERMRQMQAKMERKQ